MFALLLLFIIIFSSFTGQATFTSFLSLFHNRIKCNNIISTQLLCDITVVGRVVYLIKDCTADLRQGGFTLADHIGPKLLLTVQRHACKGHYTGVDVPLC